jgi:hypothetical protein
MLIPQLYPRCGYGIVVGDERAGSMIGATDGTSTIEVY